MQHERQVIMLHAHLAQYSMIYKGSAIFPTRQSYDSV